MSMCAGLVLLWSVLSSFDAGRRFVNAQPAVDAVILTPPLDRREGGEVQMRCVATNLEPDHTVVWRTEAITLRWGDATITPKQRYEYGTTQNNETVIQEFNITDLRSSDADEYVCNVRVLIPTGGSSVVASDRVTLSVLDSDFRFPNDSFPMCFPNGPTTVATGTELSLLCLSDGSTSTVMMEISRIPQASSSLIWTPSTTIDSQTLMLTLTVDETLDGASFRCIISSVPYPEIMRSCTIGPVFTVTEEPTTAATDPTTESRRPTSDPTTESRTPTSDPTTESRTPTSDPTTESCRPTSAASPWIAVSAVSLTLLIVSLIVNILFVRRHHHQKQPVAKCQAERELQQTPEPYTELQLKGNQSALYTEPVTNDQHTYYQPTVDEKENPAYATTF